MKPKKRKKKCFKNGASSPQVETQKVKSFSLISDTNCLGLGSLLKFETWLEWPHQLVETSYNPDNLKIIGLEGVKKAFIAIGRGTDESPAGWFFTFSHTCVSFSTGLWVLEMIMPHFCQINPSPLKGELVFITLSVWSHLTNMTALELFVLCEASSHRGWKFCVSGQNSVKLFDFCVSVWTCKTEE